MTFDDLLKGNFSEEKRVVRSTSGFGFGVSSDGKTVLKGTLAGSEGMQDWTVAPFEGGAATPIPGHHANVWYTDSTELGMMDPAPNGRLLSVLNFRTGVRRAELLVPDSNLVDFARLGNDSWLWIPQDQRSINVQRDGDPKIRKFPIPSWYQSVYHARGSSDGQSIAFTGWKAPLEDSLGMGILSVPDGRFTQTWVTFGERAGQRWLDDGSLQVEVWDTPESASFYRYRPGESVRRLGSVPHALRGLSMSRDGKRVFVLTLDDHSDAWMSKVVK
jgi:hypothetical protein